MLPAKSAIVTVPRPIRDYKIERGPYEERNVANLKLHFRLKNNPPYSRKTLGDSTNSSPEKKAYVQQNFKQLTPRSQIEFTKLLQTDPDIDTLVRYMKR